MAKKKYTYTKYEPFYTNQYSWGGDSKEALKKSFSPDKLGGTVSSVGGALTSMIGAGMNNAKLGDTSEIEANIQNAQNQTFQASSNNDLLGQWNSWRPAEQASYKDVRGGSTGQRLMSTLGAGVSGASSGAQVGGAFGAVGGAVLGLGSGIAGMITGDKKAKAKQAELNKQIIEANNRATSNFSNSTDNIDSTMNQNLLANYAAYGGYMNAFANGGQTNGAQWDNGITSFDNGSTHELNPNGGVMIGVDEEGTPNMVEEGEVRFQDYIYSNRIDVPEEMKKKYKLKKNSTFADAAKQFGIESEERPNDPISKAGLKAGMEKLQALQEEVKQKKQAQELKQMLAKMSPEELAMLQQQSQMQQGASQEGIPQMGEEQMPQEDSLQQQMISQDLNVFAGGGLANLRYAPAVGAGLGVFSDAMGWTNKADYSNADLIGNSVKNLSTVDFKPIGDMMEYKPMDRNYYMNQLYSNAGASRRAIENQSGGNRGQAMAGLLAADYNTTSNIGKLARESEEYNLNQREKVSGFNRATNMFNTEGAFKADATNKQNDELRLRAIQAQASLRQDADRMSSAGRNANLSNLFDSIGDIGREEFSRNMLNDNSSLYYEMKRNGKIAYKAGYYALSGDEKKKVDKEIASIKEANGG